MINCQTKKLISKYPVNIGDIEFDPKTDNPNFKLCFDKNVLQYFWGTNEI